MKTTTLFFFLLVSAAFFNSTKAQTITYTNSPKQLQFYARDNQDSASVVLNGTISSTGYDSVYIKLYKSIGASTSLIKTIGSGILNYSGSVAAFNLSVKLHAELAEYKLEVFAAPIGSLPAAHNLVKTVDSLVCGDAFLIAGQSNSHPANVLSTYENEFCRTLGIQTPNSNYNNYDPKDTLWGYANGHGFGGNLCGPYLVGVWGIRLMQYIKDSVNIPVCIINGGAGGTTIQENLPSGSRQALHNVYGKLGYRVQKAGLQNIKAIFWYQGEADQTGDTAVYSGRFNTLYNSWKTDYPTIQKIYVMQLHQGCTGSEFGSSRFREYQRTLSNRYPDARTISTMSLPGHEGCHYSMTGYDSLSYRLFRAVAKDFYNASSVNDNFSPDVTNVYFANGFKKTIRLKFSNSSSLLLTTYTGRNIKDYFFLDEVSGNVNAVTAQNNTVTLKLSTATSAVALTYLPGVYYTSTTTYYQGPYIVNPFHAGALSFYGKPIEDNTPYDVPVANFGYEAVQAYAGNPIPLIDSSLEWPSSFSWTAVGGTVSNASSSNPTVTFSTPGTYSVTLTVVNSFGSSAASTFSRNIVVTNPPTLPLHLTYFGIEKKGCAASLKWETADEINTGSFEIEQSEDGIRFKTISGIEAKGSGTNKYALLVSQLPGPGHYRLKIIDKDLKFSYSPIRTFMQTCSGSQESFTAYPNSTNSLSAITFSYVSSSAKGKATLMLTDVNGKIVERCAVQVRAETNRYRISDLDLPSGSYFIHLEGLGWSSTVQRIIILPSL